MIAMLIMNFNHLFLPGYDGRVGGGGDIGTMTGGQTQHSYDSGNSESLNPNAWPNSCEVKPPVCICSPHEPVHFSHRLFLSRKAQIVKESVNPTSFTSSSFNGSARRASLDKPGASHVRIL
jgi:hypothetical protein